MNERQAKVLQLVVEDYVQTAHPVGSNALVEKYDLEVSSATIRSEMLKLEDDEYIYQPHTSAGRIPTTKGLEFYFERLMLPQTVPARERQRLKLMLETGGMRAMAKAMANYSEAAVIIAFNLNDFYYTGFSYLFSDSADLDSAHVASLSSALDSVERVVPRVIRESITGKPTILIGAKNPFGTNCSACVLTQQRRSAPILIGIISAIRTNYARSTGLLSHISSII